MKTFKPTEYDVETGYTYHYTIVIYVLQYLYFIFIAGPANSIQNLFC